MNKKIRIIAIIVVIIVLSFAIYAILPYFTNTVVDEPLPTASGLNLGQDYAHISGFPIIRIG